MLYKEGKLGQGFLELTLERISPVKMLHLITYKEFIHYLSMLITWYMLYFIPPSGTYIILASHFIEHVMFLL